LHGILIIPGLVFLKKDVHKYEKLGCLLVILATALLVLDKWSLRSDSLIEVPGKKYYKYVPTLGVDMLLVFSNLPALLFFSFNRSLMRKRFLIQMCLVNFLTMLIFSLCAMLFEGSEFNLNRTNGLFGWLDSTNCFTVTFFYGFFATFFGSVGYILSMQYFNPFVCMNAFLLEPFFAQILGYFYGIDQAPGLMTVFGTIIITISLIMVTKGS
jgi:drug/metabolite transporter (DMT)-like permease